MPLKAGVYTLVMNTCARAQRFDKVEGLLNDVRKARLPLTHRDYACILSAFYKLERWRVRESELVWDGKCFIVPTSGDSCQSWRP